MLAVNFLQIDTGQYPLVDDYGSSIQTFLYQQFILAVDLDRPYVWAQT